MRKVKRIKLDARMYRRLMKRVSERDNGRCQKCGSLENLQIHHKTTRSQHGDGVLENLVVLRAHFRLAEQARLCLEPTATGSVKSLSKGGTIKPKGTAMPTFKEPSPVIKIDIGSEVPGAWPILECHPFAVVI